MTSDSTSEAARERKTRALSVRSELTVLNRLMIRILALMDGHCRAMRALLLEVRVCSRRMRLASSAWKDSSFCKRVEFRIHVLAPNSKHGNTQCSTMLLEERGLRVPWKTPLPLAKKAHLTFLMFLQPTFCTIDRETTMHPSIWQRWSEGTASHPSGCEWSRVEDRVRWMLHICQHSEPGLERRHTH